MRGAVMDIETTALGAVGAGIILLVCIRPMDTQRARVFRLDQYEFKPSDDSGIVEREETQMLTDITAEIGKYEVLIGHNLARFDVPYIKSRCFQRGLQMPPVVVCFWAVL